MISMPRWYFDIAVDNYCRPVYEIFILFWNKKSLCSNNPYSCNLYLQDLAMLFKVFKLEELYPDLQKYDLRANLRQFGIQGTSVLFDDFMRALLYHGYIYDAEVYYLNPAPRSKPPAGLVKIVGQDDFNQMVRAHAEEGTKICLLYLVSKHDDQSPDVSTGSSRQIYTKIDTALVLML